MPTIRVPLGALKMEPATTPGNIDLYQQPKVKNPDGSISTVDSSSYNLDGQEVLLPSVTPDGRHLNTDDEIIAEYRKTGRHLGKFASPAEATAYASQLHDDYAAGKYDRAPATALRVPLSELQTGQSSAPAQSPADERGVIANVGVGVLKGAGQTAANLGGLVHRIPGVSRAIDALYGAPGLSQQAFREANTYLEPTGAAQRTGKVGEQIAEVLIPGKAISGAATAAAARVPAALARSASVGVEALGGAGLAAAQGGNPIVGGLVGAAAPVLGDAVSALPTSLRESAEKQVGQALGATKERFKAMAERITPEMLRRGLRGSRESLQLQAADAAEAAGQQIDQALQAFGAQRATTQPVIEALERSKDAFRTTTPAGATVVYEPRAVKQLEGLQKVITDLGPDASVEQLVAVRRAWDKVVDQAGGFSHRAGGAIGVPLKDQSEAWAKREATGAIRKLLDAEVPQLTALNKEFAFWKSLDDVLTQTMKRTTPQGPGLGRQVAEAAGQAVGGALGSGGGPGPAVAGAYGLGKVAGMARTAFSSPRWRLASAQAKDRLADAIVSGNASQMAVALTRIGAVEGSKVPDALSGR